MVPASIAKIFPPQNFLRLWYLIASPFMQQQWQHLSMETTQKLTHVGPKGCPNIPHQFVLGFVTSITIKWHWLHRLPIDRLAQMHEYIYPYVLLSSKKCRHEGEKKTLKKHAVMASPHVLSVGGCRFWWTKSGGTKTLLTRVSCIVRGWGSDCIIGKVNGGLL